eukprot:2019746-Prymnesium_polylepis.2
MQKRARCCGPRERTSGARPPPSPRAREPPRTRRTSACRSSLRSRPWHARQPAPPAARPACDPPRADPSQ